MEGCCGDLTKRDIESLIHEIKAAIRHSMECARQTREASCQIQKFTETIGNIFNATFWFIVITHCGSWILSHIKFV